MAPKRDPASLLFHQKKKPTKEQHKSTNGTPRKPRAAPPKASTPTPDIQSLGIDLPDTGYTEFKLLSSALNGWKYDVMKFDSRKAVDVLSWQPPIKLNRKDMHKDDTSHLAGPPVKPMLGLDGKPVIGPDGNIVMVDAEGRIAAAEEAQGKGKSAAPAKKKFQKKTRQVFLVPEHLKQLRKEERYPWVIEDGSGQETWLGQLDDTTKAEMYCFFMPAANDVFKFVPAHRWYKFQKKLKHDLPRDTANVESAYQKHLKRDPTVWLHQRTGRGPSQQTAAMFKAEADGTTVDFGNSLVHAAGTSLGPGGRKLKAVDKGTDGLFEEGDDEDGGGSQRRKDKEYGGEGDMDEVVFEEEFADDEEPMEVDKDDEEAKELEERLKREYKAANKTREGYIDESDDEDSPQVSKAQRRMQKLLQKREGGDAYESDDDKNPYASEESSDEEEEVLPSMSQTTSQPTQGTEPPNSSQSSQSTTLPGTQTPPASQEVKSTDVRPTSPNSPSLGGHAVLAQRATSPKPAKIRPSSPVSGSPLGSRATSPVPQSRATSPAPHNGSRASSPVNGKKRKAEENSPNGAAPVNGQNGGQPKPKKRKPVPGVELDERMLIEWLMATPNATTRDCIQHFTPYLNSDEKKAKFTKMVKVVAVLKEGKLILRSSSAPSPAPTS